MSFHIHLCLNDNVMEWFPFQCLTRPPPIPVRPRHLYLYTLMMMMIIMISCGPTANNPKKLRHYYFRVYAMGWPCPDAQSTCHSVNLGIKQYVVRCVILNLKRDANSLGLCVLWYDDILQAAQIVWQIWIY